LAKRILFFALLSMMLMTVFMPATSLAYDELKNTDPDKYYILLDIKNQFVTVFEKDENGEYTKVVRRFICTTGRTKLDPADPEDKGTPTPKGIYKIGGRERFGEFASFRGTFARYWTQIVGGIYFHSIMFSERDVETLQSGAFRGLGHNSSHGCVRLYVEDAKWLYYYAPPGTIIEVSTTEPSNRSITKKLKTTLSFSEYELLQGNIFDIDPLPNKSAWVVKEEAPLRTGNGGEDHIRMRLDIGTQLEVLQTGEPWCKVKYENKEGYMLTAFLTFEKGTMSSKEDADIIKSTNYMYTLPNEESEKIVKVPTYSSVKILEPDKEGWTKIYYFGETGYIETRYLKKGWGTIIE
jgi:hypothetical protein